LFRFILWYSYFDVWCCFCASEYGCVKLQQNRFLLEPEFVNEWLVHTIGRLVLGFLAIALKYFTCQTFLGEGKKYLRHLPVRCLVLSGHDLKCKTCSLECWKFECNLIYSWFKSMCCWRWCLPLKVYDMTFVIPSFHISLIAGSEPAL
jgi:hypothetical protein